MTIDESTLVRALRWASVGELSSRVAHESNNLLAGVLGQAELGLLSNDPVRMKTALDSIVKSARDLKALTERHLGFARSTEPDPRNANLLETFRSLFGLLERSFAKSGVEVDRHYGNVPMTYCDPGGAAQPLLFGLCAALETLRKAGGGRLELAAALEKDEIVFTIRAAPPSGNTPGLDNVRAGALSFAIAEQFAKGEGGSLALDRDGSSWRILYRLPVRAEPAGAEDRSQRAIAAPPGEPVEPAAAAGRVPPLEPRPVLPPTATETPSPTPRRPISVLVVEDEEPIRELIQEVLEGADCRVRAEPDGLAAVRAFELSRFDVVLTDISMPGMDGVTLIRRLRALDRRVVMVAVTGRPTQQAVREAREAGATIVLRKPFDLADLRTIIQSVRLDPSGERLRESLRTAGSVLVG